MKKGFTLLEMLLVLSVMIILAMIAVPSLKKFSERNRARIAVSQVLSVLRAARGFAIKQGEPVKLCPSHDRTSCGGQWPQGYLLIQMTSHKIVRSSDWLNTGDKLSYRGFPRRGYLKFHANGGSDNGTFTYTSKAGLTRCILISKSGRARQKKCGGQ